MQTCGVVVQLGGGDYCSRRGRSRVIGGSRAGCRRRVGSIARARASRQQYGRHGHGCRHQTRQDEAQQDHAQDQSGRVGGGSRRRRRWDLRRHRHPVGGTHHHNITAGIHCQREQEEAVVGPASALPPCRHTYHHITAGIHCQREHEEAVVGLASAPPPCRRHTPPQHHIWNTLPTDVIAASSLSTFRQLLKRFLFKQSYPDIIR